MQFDIQNTLAYRSYNVRLQQKFCSAHGRNPHRFSAASRHQSNGQDAVVKSQDSGEAKGQNVDLEPAAERDSSMEFTRRDLIRGLLAGTMATTAPALLPASQAPLAEAIPIISRLPPIGQAAPGTHILGVAAVRDPGLYRLVLCLAILKSHAQHQLAKPCYWQGHGNQPSCQE